MARSVVLLICVASLAPEIIRAQTGPIRAQIGSSGAATYSGPDEAHYSTSRLQPGDEVDIYRLDPGQWCAVRPPPDSFSLIRAEALEWVDDQNGIGKIAADDERCWVGTMLGEVSEPTWQLKLRRDEQVHVLGMIESADNPGRAEWYQIAPPNGEFRWIRWSDLDEYSQEQVDSHFGVSHSIARSNELPQMVLIEDGHSVAGPNELPERTLTQESDPHAQSNFSDQDSERADPASEVAFAGYNQGTDEPRSPRATSSTGRWRTPQHRRSLSQVDYQTTAPPAGSIPFVASNSSGRADSPQSFSSNTATITNGPRYWPARLQELDLRLSTEVLKEPSQWRLDSIAADVMNAKLSGSPDDAPIADHLLNKIRQFQLVQSAPSRQANSLPAVPVQGVTAVVGQDPIPLLRVAPGAANGSANDYVKSFDAYGWLNELVRNEGMGQTTYVLQDDNGKITHLLAATPGLNLHRYLKTKVGVIGQKGFNRQMNLDHVTAERIVSLDSLRR